MEQKDETVFEPQEMSALEQSGHSEKSKKTSWRRVAVGGVSGILLGTGAAYAANQLEGGQEESDLGVSTASGTAVHSAAKTVLPEATQEAEVDDDVSFGEAFAAARSEVGTGGFFEWRGNVYSTFTKEEWDHLSPQDRDVYAQRVVSNSGSADEQKPTDEPVDAQPVNPEPGDDETLASIEPIETDPEGDPIDGSLEVQILGEVPADEDDPENIIELLTDDVDDDYVADDVARADMMQDMAMDDSEFDDVSMTADDVDIL